jgi:hypothetical protein
MDLLVLLEPILRKISSQSYRCDFHRRAFDAAHTFYRVYFLQEHRGAE